MSTHLRETIRRNTRIAETRLLPDLIRLAQLPARETLTARALALRLSSGVRERSQRAGRAGFVQDLLREFSLSSDEGIALLCLAEALLRIPDNATRDALIRDKVSHTQWEPHLGQSSSLFVNAATWGLLISARVVAKTESTGLGAGLHRIVGRAGEPLIRKGIDLAVRLMGEQFVCGETIEQALHNAAPRMAEGFQYSFDMLGEAAISTSDSLRYLTAYEHAIDVIGKASRDSAVSPTRPHFGTRPSISIKLSALHPRYQANQRVQVWSELYPRLLQLCLLARSQQIGIQLDAEESERLELSLDLLESLCLEPTLAGWDGIGFVVQAYQKRGPAVIDFLVDLAQRSRRRLIVRLVKGAYWDSEIKRAQVEGLTDYPVYTRKAHTDIAYLACARQLLSAPRAIDPQFATHNALTVATIVTMVNAMGPVSPLGSQMARPHPKVEFQGLFGMGESLYSQVIAPAPAGGLGLPCRIYAPVGPHETLLAYLVRRLLENGANSSFVHQIADPSISLDTLLTDPIQRVLSAAQHEGELGRSHPNVPLPPDLYGALRRNARGRDLADTDQQRAILLAIQVSEQRQVSAEPMLGDDGAPNAFDDEQIAQFTTNPADASDRIGWVRSTSPSELERALQQAQQAAPTWAATSPRERATLLEHAADLLESSMEPLMALLIREAGKSASNALGEVREGIDFLRYYAQVTRATFHNATHLPLGPVLCISPWNFPLAIFVGQIAGALAAGNVVLAKPAEQTPLIAAEITRLLHRAGVPTAALQLLPGLGETVGAALVEDARVLGVVFTGSTEVARIIQRSLAQRLGPQGRPIPLIAETGGRNAMIVDSSVVPEQAISDILVSAFDSAGQRCSALRLLCIQREASERLLALLTDAMAELQIGDPRHLDTDIGPVIDAQASANIHAHLERMRARGHRVHQPSRQTMAASHTGPGFIVPTLIEIDRPSDLGPELFGPVLHVLRYEQSELEPLLQSIRALGDGLTMGVQSRIDETIHAVVETAHVGNLYVNRSMIGAVVGVQPFGGQGLSGTGPKAGGPLYLQRLLAKHPRGLPPALAPLGQWLSLPGPTGESNRYRLCVRDRILCLADDGRDADAALLVALQTVSLLGGHVFWPASAQALWHRLSEHQRTQVSLTPDWTRDGLPWDVVLHHGTPASRLGVGQALACRPGPISSLIAFTLDEGPPIECLVIEQSLCINTAAAGGNASLMTLADEWQPTKSQSMD